MSFGGNNRTVIRTEAVVTRLNKLSERDLIVSLLTPRHGLLRAVAKGARNPKAQRGAALDLLQHSVVFVRFGRQLHSVSQANAVTDFGFYAKDARLFAYGCYLVESAELFAREGQANKQAFDLLITALKATALTRRRDLLCRWFDMRLLQINGFALQAHSCVECDRALAAQDCYFSNAMGGAICKLCLTRAPAKWRPVKVSADLMALLRLIGAAHWRKLDAAEVSPPLLNQLNNLLGAYIAQIHGRRAKAAKVLAELSS